MMKLYIYDHCPYCVKARMIFGLKKRPVELHILLNDDETTPISMVGKKVVPILQKEDGSYMPESMDIVYYIDQLDGHELLTGETSPDIAEWLKTVSSYLSRLLIPRYIQLNFAEFAIQSARDYYTHKKTAAIGSFDEHLHNTPSLLDKLNADLQVLETLLISDSACNGSLSTDDIHLFAALRGISAIKGVHMPQKVDVYRRKMAENSGINLLDDMAV